MIFNDVWWKRHSSSFVSASIVAIDQGRVIGRAIDQVWGPHIENIDPKMITHWDQNLKVQMGHWGFHPEHKGFLFTIQIVVQNKFTKTALGAVVNHDWKSNIHFW